MSERFIRCAHCGLPHDAHLDRCPTTGLLIERHNRPRKRKAGRSRARQAEQERMIGKVIGGKYRVVDAIGEGGMSSIYEAEHLGLSRRVALKVLHASLADDREAIARLRQEAQVVATVGHPNICEVFDMGRMDNGSHYLVMERLHGESLADRIKAVGSLSFLEIAPLVRQILSALEAAHAKGILHRDLKPENIFIEDVRSTGGVRGKLLDFGISKSMTYDFIENQRLTHTGMVMGTPYYMAPEQARGDSGLDQRVDLWAVGVIMYEALTGRRPFVATNYNALLVKILTSKPRPVQKLNPAIPDGAASIVAKALSKLREDRFQDARVFARELSLVERAVAAEEAAQATMMMRRKVRQMKPVSASDWSKVIDDPSTHIDDEVPEPSHTLPDEPPAYAPQPRATVPDRPAARRVAERVPVAQPAASHTWEDYTSYPVAPTVGDAIGPPEDWEQSVPYEPDQRLRLDQAPMDDGMVTEVMDRKIAERMARRPRYGVGFAAEGTEILDRKALEERAALVRELSRVPVDSDDPDGGPTVPTDAAAMHALQALEANDETTMRQLTRAEPPPGKGDGTTSRKPNRPSARPKSKPRRSERPRASDRPRAPRVPRPRVAPEDEEKTTLFDIEAARKKLGRGSSPEDGDP